MKKGNKEIVSLSLKPETLNCIDAFCSDYGMTKSQAIDFIMRLFDNGGSQQMVLDMINATSIKRDLFKKLI